MDPDLTTGDFSDALAEFMQRDVDCASDVAVVVLAELTDVENGGVVPVDDLGEVGEVRDAVGP